MPVLKGASRQVPQDHSSLQILPVLFPLALSNCTRSLDCCFHGCSPSGRGKSQAGIFKCHRALTRKCSKFFFSEVFPLAVVIPDYSTASAKVDPENFCQLFWLFLWGNRALDFLTLSFSVMSIQYSLLYSDFRSQRDCFDSHKHLFCF